MKVLLLVHGEDLFALNFLLVYKEFQIYIFSTEATGPVLSFFRYEADD